MVAEARSVSPGLTSPTRVSGGSGRPWRAATTASAVNTFVTDPICISVAGVTASPLSTSAMP